MPQYRLETAGIFIMYKRALLCDVTSGVQNTAIVKLSIDQTVLCNKGIEKIEVALHLPNETLPCDRLPMHLEQTNMGLYIIEETLTST